MIQPNTAYSSCGTGEKGSGSASAPVDCLTTCSKGFPPGMGWLWQTTGWPMEKAMLPSSAVRKTYNLKYSMSMNILNCTSRAANNKYCHHHHQPSVPEPKTKMFNLLSYVTKKAANPGQAGTIIEKWLNWLFIYNVQCEECAHIISLLLQFNL